MAPSGQLLLIFLFFSAAASASPWKKISPADINGSGGRYQKMGEDAVKEFNRRNAVRGDGIRELYFCRAMEAASLRLPRNVTVVSLTLMAEGRACSSAVCSHFQMDAHRAVVASIDGQISLQSLVLLEGYNPGSDVKCVANEIN